MEQVRVVTAVFCVLLLLQIIRSVRREHIRVEYSMAWLGAVLLLLALSLSDTALGWLASDGSRWLGIEDFSLVLLPSFLTPVRRRAAPIDLAGRPSARTTH